MRAILQHGCRKPLVLCEGIIIDGHNRHEISNKHDIPFKTISMESDRSAMSSPFINTFQVSENNTPPHRSRTVRRYFSIPSASTTCFYIVPLTFQYTASKPNAQALCHLSLCDFSLFGGTLLSFC